MVAEAFHALAVHPYAPELRARTGTAHVSHLPRETSATFSGTRFLPREPAAGRPRADEIAELATRRSHVVAMHSRNSMNLSDVY